MAKTREQFLKDKRECMAKIRARDLDAARAYGRKYHSLNREKQTQKMRDYYTRRFFWGRATKLRGEGKANYKDLAALWKKQKGKCALTGRKLDRTADLDHITPKTRGGKDNVENLRWLHREVNMVKRNLTDDEFLTLCFEVLAWCR